MTRSVCSVHIFIAYILVCFLCITSLTSGREIPNKRLGHDITPFNTYQQKRKTEDRNNEEKTLNNLNKNHRTIGTAIINARGLLGRVFNSIFHREQVDPINHIPPTPIQLRSITTDKFPIPNDGPRSPTDILTLPTNVPLIPSNRRPKFIDTSGSGSSEIPQALFVSQLGGLRVIPAPDLTKPNFLKQAFPGNFL